MQHRSTPDSAARTMTILGLIVAMLLAGCGDARRPLSPPAQAEQLKGAQVLLGRQLIESYGCVACHTVPGIKGPISRVGPPLEEMALRAYIGGVLPNTPGNLVKWLMNPPAADPRTAMPYMGISAADAKHIAAYLLTLQ